MGKSNAIAATDATWLIDSVVAWRKSTERKGYTVAARPDGLASLLAFDAIRVCVRRGEEGFAPYSTSRNLGYS